MLSGPRFYFIRGFPVPVACQPPQVLDAEQQPPVALDLLQVAALVEQQPLVLLVAGQDVDDVPERRPTQEAGPAHEPGQQAGGGADLHGYQTTRPSAQIAFFHSSAMSCRPERFGWILSPVS